MYFSVYYASGALGGYLPGLAWQRWQWSGVAGGCLVVLAGAILLVTAQTRLVPE